jgi:hypothetical protein
LYPRHPGIPERMTDLPMEDVDRTQQEREREGGRDDHENELLEEQEHKGYGEDEGERDEALPD